MMEGQPLEMQTSRRTGIFNTQADGHFPLIYCLQVSERPEFPRRLFNHLIDQRQRLGGQLALALETNELETI